MRKFEAVRIAELYINISNRTDGREFDEALCNLATIKVDLPPNGTASRLGCVWRLDDWLVQDLERIGLDKNVCLHKRRVNMSWQDTHCAWNAIEPANCALLTTVGSIANLVDIDMIMIVIIVG